MEYIPQIKQFMESNLADEDLQSVMSASESKSCHPNLACSVSMWEWWGQGEASMDGGQTRGKQNKVLCL